MVLGHNKVIFCYAETMAIYLLRNKDASEFIFLKILMRYHVNFHIQQKPTLEDNLQRQL